MVAHHATSCFTFFDTLFVVNIHDMTVCFILLYVAYLVYQFMSCYCARGCSICVHHTCTYIYTEKCARFPSVAIDHLSFYD